MAWFQRTWVPLMAFSLPVYALDQLTKLWVLHAVPPHAQIPVVPGFFNLVHVYNTGAAFGMGRDNNSFFLALAVVALVLFLAAWFRRAFPEPGARLALALLIPGVAGNLTDRIFHGHVIDFLDFVLPWYGHWPAFNVADSAIFLAAASMVLAAVFSKSPAGKQQKNLSKS